MAKSNMEKIETCICMICLDTPKDAENCQYCSQLVCKLCIDDWFKQNTKNKTVTCPQCRKFVQRNNFKKLPCVQNLLELVNDREKELGYFKMNECSQHAKQQLCVYCSTCSKAICAQCISTLFNGEHITHVYCELDSAQKRLLQAFDEQNVVVDSDLQQMLKSIQNTMNANNQIQVHKQKIFNELEEFQKNIKKEINSNVANLMIKYQDKQILLNREIDDYNMKRRKLKETIQSLNQSKLFEQEKELKEQILQRINISIADQIDSSNISINNPVAVPWLACKTMFEQFSVRRKNNVSVSTSSRQNYCNQYWMLTVYANGKGIHQGVYLSVTLQLKEGVSQLIEYDVTIELIHHLHDDNQHNYILKTEKLFKEGQTQEFEQFYPLNKLSDNGFINPQTDSLTVRFKLCPTSIIEERKVLRWLIEFYQKENKEMKKTTDELTRLQEDNKNANQTIEDLRNKIQELESNEPQNKRKRTSSNRLKK